MKTWFNRLALMAGMALLFLGEGCLQVPSGYQTIGPQAVIEPPLYPAGYCHPGVLVYRNESLPEPLATIDGSGFTLISWNLQKGKQPGWYADLDRLIGAADIVLLQEARLSVELMRVLNQTSEDWDMAPAFIYRNNPIGVLTAAQATPLKRCMLRTPEPLLRLPKSTLITRYAFSAGESHLVVVNLHGINFTLGTTSYRKLWQTLTTVLKTHPGPLIVAGDFNTWNDERTGIVEEAMANLGLTAVRFKEGKRSLFQGHAVDHVYYRGLMPLDETVPRVESSDHHPLMVKFKLFQAPC